MRFSTFIVALKRFLQVPLDDTSVILAFVLLHNQVVFANPAVTFGGDVVNAGEFQLDPELIRATYEFHHPAQSLTSVHHIIMVSVFHVLFGQALHQQAVGHPWSCHGSSSTRLPYPNSSWADLIGAIGVFLCPRVPVFPTPSPTPATTPAQPEISQPPPPVQENPVPPVQENPVPPVPRRSTRRRQRRRYFFLFKPNGHNNTRLILMFTHSCLCVCCVFQICIRFFKMLKSKVNSYVIFAH